MSAKTQDEVLTIHIPRTELNGLLAENAQLRAQATELQAHSTAMVPANAGISVQKPAPKISAQPKPSLIQKIIEWNVPYPPHSASCLWFQTKDRGRCCLPCPVSAFEIYLTAMEKVFRTRGEL